MFVAVLFIPIVAGNIFLESEFHRLPKITERNNKREKTYMLFDPCYMRKAGKRAVSCSELRRRGKDETFYYDINPHNEFQVKCDMETDGGGWTVIQRRGRFERYTYNTFEKTYKEYEEGFGEAAKSYWIGNKNLHELTTLPNRKQVLKIVLTLKETGENITVEYNNFQVSSTNDEYRLTIGKYKGPNGYDALTSHNGGSFMIGKSDYQAPHKNCHTLRSGGWWHSPCFLSNLNGRKFELDDKQDKMDLGINWSKEGDANSYNDNFYQVEMMIREADFEFCMGKMAK